MKELLDRVRSAELILLPKSDRELPDVTKWLIEVAGVEVPDFTERGYLVKAEGRQFALVKAMDALGMTANRKATICFAGSDKFKEYQYSQPGWATRLRIAPIGQATCRFVLAGPDPGISLKGEQPLIVATSLPNTARAYAQQKGYNFYVEKYRGSVEAMPSLEESDIIADIVQKGDTLAANDLVELETMTSIYPGVVWRSDFLPPPNPSALPVSPYLDGFTEALQTINRRRRDVKSGKSPTSYTEKLMASRNEANKKFGSEVVEFVSAREVGSREEKLNEAADVLYSLSIMLEQEDINLADALGILVLRNQQARLGYTGEEL